MLGRYGLLLALVLLAVIVFAVSSRAFRGEVEVLSIDFSDAGEALKHLDNETEVYDSGNDGTAEAYIDTGNGWLVFVGDNSDTSQGYDEPIVVVKGYNESNGQSSYAVLPYNYTVTIAFNVPSTPGYGNVYVLPRYSNVSNKYEVVVDIENNNLVFNYVKDDSWHSLKTSPLNFTVRKDYWYKLTVNITWEYNVTQGKYVNHIIARIIDTEDPSNTFKDEVWDDNLPPDTYSGLAFLGFDNDTQFKVYVDDITVTTAMEEVGVEPDETSIAGWGGGDLDVTSMYVWNDTSNLYVYLNLSSPITIGSDTKYWAMEFDLDLDSRNTETGFDKEYAAIISLDTNGNGRADLYDEAGSWLGQLHILGGGIGYKYLIVQIPLASLTGMGETILLQGYTQEGTSVYDNIPSDDTGNGGSGDYYVYYLKKPSLAWAEILDDGDDSLSPRYLEILYLNETYDTSNLYFGFTVAGSIPWNGGGSVGRYQVFIDSDNNAGTGYEINGIGADYLLEYNIGWAPKLYEYTGTGTDWSWSLVKREFYTYNPGGSENFTLVVVKQDLQPSSGTIAIVGQTVQDSTGIDVTNNIPVPVPEPWTTSLTVIIIASIILLLYAKKKNNKTRH